MNHPVFAIHFQGCAMTHKLIISVYISGFSPMFFDHLEENFRKADKRLTMQKTIRLRWSHLRHWVGNTNYKVLRT